MPSLAGLFSRRYAIAIALTIVTLYLIRDRGPDLETIRGFAHLDGSFLGVGRVSQKQFVKQALKDGIYVRQYNGTAVRKLCGEAKWREGLVVSCDAIAGGIGNLKMRLLGCTRYAIEAGAMLLSPAIHPREAFAKMETSFGWDVNLPLSYMFDGDHYYHTLAQDCPQLRIVNDTVPGLVIPPKSASYRCNGAEMAPPWKTNIIVSEQDKWRPAFDKWLEDVVLTAENLTALSNDHPVRVSWDDVIQFNWPTAYDGPDFRNDWGHLAVLPRRIRELSARALYNLFQRLDCKEGPATVSRKCFLGVHIRTEADAAVENWDSYEVQLQHVREQLAGNALSALYVATGTASEVDRLRADLADTRIRINDTHEEPVRVLHKWDLFDEEDLLFMDTLTWDQMALVDHDIMLRATRFAGIWQSSWSWTIAMKRHEWSDVADPMSRGFAFEDGLSIVYGPPGHQGFIPPTIYP